MKNLLGNILNLVKNVLKHFVTNSMLPCEKHGEEHLGKELRSNREERLFPQHFSVNFLRIIRFSPFVLRWWNFWW
ncbi:MAG: hypothetical protein LBU34_17005 [Planctomycetaceae bacterium]|jgi:hypothetical protein|nr:hypothetical protein [Planctomycetaceae bacterium]